MNQIPQNAAKKSDRRLTIVLALVIVAAVAIALATTRTSHGAAAPDASTPPSPPAADSAAPPVADNGAVNGEVLETVPVSKYTYLRLRTSDGEVWAAVPSASVAIGSRVTISNATRMDDFKSQTLGRSFKVIYFGTLGAPASDATGDPVAPKFPVDDEPGLDSDQTLPPGHPDIGSNSAPVALPDGANALPSGHPDIGGLAAGTASPHGGMSDSSEMAEPLLPLPKIARAMGGNGHLIAELAADRQKLAGQRVRVRGQVTKVTPDVRGRAFFHLRDASVSGRGSTTDLVVTSVSEPRRGQVATFEGTLRADDDIGIGYEYPVLLEDAIVVGDGK